jgi:uncharacterized protein involved in exopolysaccharide biosynthesis
MQNLQDNDSINEINLYDLFITFWAYKLFIVCTCVLGIILGGYIALNKNKLFTSSAIFKLDVSSSQSISLGDEINALASLAGIGSGSATLTMPIDQITGRVFIEKLDKKLNFRADKYFNTYNPNSAETNWKSAIKRAIGWQKKFPRNTEDATWQGIVQNYRRNIELDVTKEGSLKIMFTHEDPKRAAEIANVIMNTIINNTKDQKNDEQDQILSYLSNTLADALNDLEAAQSNLKEFALKTTYKPIESFAAGSLMLGKLREQLSRTSKLHDAVAALSLMLQNKTTEQNNYLTLRRKFPIVDQVEFRRILGQNEIISSWSWPEVNIVESIFETLSERKSRLQSEIDASQSDAERSSIALQTYAKLEREAEIAEATYTVLIEQVKAQSLATGYRPDKTEVYEYASVPTTPSAPQQGRILFFGAILGLSFGIACTLLWSRYRGVYYSKENIKTAVRARLVNSIQTIKPLRNKSLDDINKMLMKKPRTILRDMAVEIHNSNANQIIVTSLRTKLTGNDVAKAIAMYMQSDTMKIAMINFSSKAKNFDVNKGNFSLETFIVAESVGDVSVLKPKDDITALDLLSQKDFANNIQLLTSTFDLVFFCADNDDAVSLLRALKGQKTFHITHARTKRTKSADLAQINSLIPIQGLLHD